MSNRRPERWVLLDAIKSFCVAFMILGHNIIWWVFSYRCGIFNDWELKLFEPHIFLIITSLVLSIPITAGMSLRFFFQQGWNSKSQKLCLRERPYLIDISKTAALLFISGFTLNVFIWDSGWQLPHLFSWNVLQFFALCLLLITFFLKLLRFEILITIVLVLFFITPWLRGIFSSAGVSYLGMIFLGYPNGLHVWPLFPWITIVVFGFWISHLYISFSRKIFITTLLGLGTLSVITFFQGDSLQQINVVDIWGPYIFQPPTLRILAQFGIFSLALVLMSFVFDKRVLSKYNPINVFSRAIFQIYLFHFAFGIWLTNMLRVTENIFFLILSISIQFAISYVIGVVVVSRKQPSLI